MAAPQNSLADWQQRHYIALNYQPPQGSPVAGSGIDFSRLKPADYRKDPLVLVLSEDHHIVLPNLTNRHILHLIRAGEKQNCCPSLGGWWNIFFGIPLLISLCRWYSRYKEVHDSTRKILEAVLGAGTSGVNKLLDPKQGDPQLARLLVRAIINGGEKRLSIETARRIVEYWSNGNLSRFYRAFDEDEVATIREMIATTTGKDSPGVGVMRKLAEEPATLSGVKIPRDFPEWHVLDFGSASGPELIGAFQMAVQEMGENAICPFWGFQLHSRNNVEEIVQKVDIVISRQDHQQLLENSALLEVLLKALQASVLYCDPNGDPRPAYVKIIRLAESVDPINASPELREAACIALASVVYTDYPEIKRAAAVKLLALVATHPPTIEELERGGWLNALGEIRNAACLADLKTQVEELIGRI